MFGFWFPTLFAWLEEGVLFQVVCDVSVPIIGVGVFFTDTFVAVTTFACRHTGEWVDAHG